MGTIDTGLEKTIIREKVSLIEGEPARQDNESAWTVFSYSPHLHAHFEVGVDGIEAGLGAFLVGFA